VSETSTDILMQMICVGIMKFTHPKKNV
jgi:hypothetical protein